MGRRRFYASANSFAANQKSVTLAGDEARHLRDVLRLKPGDVVYVFDGEGREVECSVVAVRKDQTDLEILQRVEPAAAESPLKLTMGVALIKGDKFDLVIQKLTELGVTTIVPLTTMLADVRLRDAGDAGKRVTRWQRIAMEAAKQSGRAVVPTVGTATAFEMFIEHETVDARFMFSERDGQSLSEARKTILGNVSSISAIVGPEGGWAGAELALAQQFGWSIVTMGGRTLRAETAAITIAALLEHQFGDLT